MRPRHFGFEIFALILAGFSLEVSAQLTQYDLLPADSPTDPEYLITLAKRYERIHGVSQLDAGFREDVSLYVFGESADCLIRLVRVKIESEVQSEFQLGYLVEYCAINDRGNGAINSIWHCSEVTKAFAHELSTTSMYFALRANSNALFDSVLRGEPRMLLSVDLGLYGQAYKPPLDSPLGRYLGVMKDLLTIMAEDSATLEAVEVLRLRLSEIRVQIAPLDGRWNLEVRELFDASLKLDSDLIEMERFRLDDLNLLRPPLPP